MLGIVLAAVHWTTNAAFEGNYIDGKGDSAYLRALDDSYAMLQPSSSMACLPMLYNRDWNGFVEGPTWGAWWIQNSLGPSYTMMPFLTEPYQSWLTNSQDMWFAMMGDGKHKDFMGAIGPVGCLCDAATPSGCWYRQGDGNVAIHDWCIGFTAAGLILECELMLVKRDKAEIARMLPKLEAVAAFLDSRRDPKTDLLLGGVASNLLAPSYGGWLRPDGSRDKAYLSELSVNYIAGLNRLIEVCRMAGRNDRAAVYSVRRDLVKRALPQLMTDDGCFIQALQPDGIRQGVYGEPKSGFFETAPNHDAICFRVVDDKQASQIYRKIKSIAELRPYGLILPNYPSYDNMYDNQGLFSYGVWVNGGHWTTAEARMIMSYYRVGAQADALTSFNRIHDLATAYRADNNLTDRGAKLYQPGQPYNVVYDCWGAPGGMLRGLFEYEYSAKGLRLYPHLPSGVSQIAQKFPVLFGAKRVYISASGAGPITRVLVDGKPVWTFDRKSVFLALNDRPANARVQIEMGGASAVPLTIPKNVPISLPVDPGFWRTREFDAPRSQDPNPLCIGISPSGSNGFFGQIRDVRIYRSVLTGADLRRDIAGGASISTDKLLIRFPLDKPIQGTLSGGRARELLAQFEGPHPPKDLEGGMTLDGESGLAIKPSLMIDFQDDFTLEAWIRPTTLPQGGSRIIDRCTVGASDGYNFDFINAGKTLRLINVTGVVEAPVQLKANTWQHVAATCDKSGLMRLFLDGKLVGETRGTPYTVPPPSRVMPNLSRVGQFAKALQFSGLGQTFAGQQSLMIVRMIASLHAHRRLVAISKPTVLPGIPPARLAGVDDLYASTIDKLTLGLMDHLKRQSTRTDQASITECAIARKSGLL